MSYNGKTNWQNNEIVEASDMNRIEQGILDVDAELGNVQTALDGKVDDSQVLTNVPANAKFTDTVYTHPATHPASMITDLPTGKKVARFVVGTSTAGWTLKDCDYLCDGTADDAEINAAITALPATGGEVVILDGTYDITAKIDVIKDNVSIKGNGNATILRRMFDSSVQEGVITLTGRSGCKIANLQIEGNKTSYTNNNNYGIYLYDSNDSTITCNTCNNNNYSIYLYASSDNAITGNTCNNNDYGIYLISGDNTITGNTCNNNNYGIYLYVSTNNTITGNTCNNNSNDGIYLASSDSTITGNTCNNNSNDGIYLYASSDSTITGNTCNNNDYGIYLYDLSRSTITGNTCNNNNYGIYLNYSRDSTITGNTCIRGIGLATDYTASQHTIQLHETDNSCNLIAMNNCMGKAVTIEGGTGNTLFNNKFDATFGYILLFTSESGISNGDINLSKPYTDFKRLIFVYYFSGQESKEVFVDELGNQSILLRALNLVDSPTAPNPGAVTFFEMKVTVVNAQQLTIVSSANVMHNGETVVRDDPNSTLVGTILSVYGSYI